MLLKKAVEWSNAVGIELLFLWPRDRAVPFYEREGFKRDNEIIEFELGE